MTLADRIADVLTEHGPMAGCVIATTIRRRKAEVIAALHADGRFAKTGRARASRWRISEVEGIDAAELARRWERELEISAYVAEMFVADFISAGLLESVKGNDAVMLTARGRELVGELISGGGA
jgi:hypothetical protein